MFKLTKYISIVLLVSFVFLTPTSIFGATWNANFNPNFNYQGRLVDSSDVAVANGNYNMRFNLYTAPTGGSPIWTETLTSTNQVPVTSGLFSVMLGSTTPLTGIDFNQTLYLTVEIGGTAGVPVWDGEMSPRKVLGAVPAAMVAYTLNGLDSTQFVRSDATSTISTNSAQTSLTINQSGVGNLFDVQKSGVSQFSVLPNGISYTNSTGTQATTTNLFSTNGTFTNLFTSNLNLTTLTTSGLGAFGSLLVNGSSTFQNFTALNSTSTNATTTNLFSSNGTFTNLFTGNFSLNTLTASGLGVFGNLLVNGSTTLQNFTASNSTTTNATTTSLAISSIISKILKTDANGSVLGATAGTDYENPLTFSAGVTRSVNNVTVDQSFSPTWTGAHIFNNITRSTTTNATTTNLAVTTLCLTGDTCRTSWPTPGSSASSTLLADNNSFTGANSFSSLLLTGSSTFQNLTFSNATGTNATTTNLAVTTLCLTGDTCRTSWPTAGTSASSTLLIDNNSFTGANTFSTVLLTGSSTFQNITFLNATGTNATTTNFFSTTASSTNLFSTSANTGSLNAGNLTGAGLSTCNGTTNALIWSGGLFGCNTITASGGSGTDVNWSFFNNSGIRVATSSNQVLIGAGATSTLSKLEVIGGSSFDTSTTTNATTTNFFATTASSTNLFSTALNTGLITSGLINGQNISSAANFTGTLTATGGLSTLSNLLVNGSTTLQNFTASNSTTTNATTTSLAISSIISKILKTDANGSVLGATAGTDYENPLTFSAGVTRSVNNVTVDQSFSPTWTGAHIFNNITRSTTTNATTTNIFSTTASSTSLFTSDFSASSGATLFTVNSTGVSVGTSTGFGVFQVAFNDPSAATNISNGSSVILRNSNNTINSGDLIKFQGSNNLNVAYTGAVIGSQFTNVTSGSEASDLFFSTRGVGGVLEAMRIKGSGNVGVGIAAPLFKFEVNGAASTTSFNTSNLLVLGSSTLQNFTGQTATTSSLALSGSVTSDTTRGLLNLSGTALVSGDGSGTYLGANPASFAGDFLRFQINGSDKVRLSASGVLTMTNSGNTISASPLAGFSTSVRTVSPNVYGTSTAGAVNLSLISTQGVGSGDDIRLKLGNNGSVEMMRLTQAGNGMGTTTPQWLLQLASSTAPQLTLSDPSNVANNHWSFRNAGGFFYLATSSPSTFATSTTAALSINPNGNITVPNSISIQGNSTTTNATTTALAISSITSCSGTNALTTNSSGSVLCGAVSGSGGSSFPFTVQTWGVSTTTTLGFFNGFISNASSTINANLLINGNSTTTNATTTNFFSTLGTFNSAFISNLTASGSTTLQNFTFNNATGTSATTTNFFTSILNVGSDALNVVSSGFVGIGTSTPGSKFSLSGAGLGGTIFNVDGGVGDPTGTGGSIRLKAGSAPIFAGTDGGVISLTGGTGGVNNDGNGGGITLTGGNAGGLGSPGNITLTPGAGVGTRGIFLAPSGGNVGIGNSSPVYTLDVTGDFNLSGNSTSTSATSTNIFATNGTFTNFSTTNISVVGLTATNSTTTNATTTNLFSTTASSTNLFATLGNIGSLTVQKLSNLTSNGFVKTTGGDGTLSIDTNTYLTSASLTATYPVQISANNISLAFGTTTNNLWSGTNIFQNASTTIVGGLTVGGIATTSSLVLTGPVFLDGTKASLNLSGTNLSGADGSGTYLGANPASFGGDFVRFQLGGLDRFRLTNGGILTVTNGVNSIVLGPALGISTTQGITVNASSTLQNFTALNSTSTNATTTNFFSTTASSTNLFASNFSAGSGSNLFTVNSTGVSVGTSTGFAIFQVAFNDPLAASSASNASSIVIRNTNNTVNNAGIIKFQGTNASNVVFTGAFIGTQYTDMTASSEDADLFFATKENGNAAEQMRIKNNGFVGIGTSSPYAKLSVNGETVAAKFTATTTGFANRSILQDFTFTNATGTSATTTNFAATTICLTGDICRTTWPTAGSSASTTLLNDNNGFSGLNTFTDLRLVTRSTTTNATTTNLFSTTASSTNLFSSLMNIGSNALTVNSSGNVGLNTPSPTAQLQIIGTSTVFGTGMNLFEAKASTANGAGSLFVDQLGNTYMNGIAIGYDTSLSKPSVSSSGQDLYIGTDFSGSGTNHNILIIPNGTGKVGIGTTSPLAKLDVAGSNNATNLLFQLSSVSSFATTTRFSISNSGDMLVSGSTTLQNFTAVNSTTTNATSTNHFATTASSTNLFSTIGNIATLTAQKLSNLVSNGLVKTTGGDGTLSVDTSSYLTTAVTSVNASGGTTGLSFSGGPVTTTGTLTLAGTLGVANGGTGATTYGQGWIYSTGGTTALSASTSPTVAYITATSTATSTFAGPIMGTSLVTNLTSTSGLIFGSTSTPQMLAFDTLNNRVQVGLGTGSASPTLFVADTKNTSGDPTGVNGAMYYNSNSNQMRCFVNSAWSECGGILNNATSTNATTTTFSISSIVSKLLKTNSNGTVQGISASSTFPIMNASANPDTGGNAWFEPYTITATNDNFGHMAFIASSTSATTGVYGTFHVPDDFGSNALVCGYWTAPITTGAVVLGFAYRDVGGNDTTSLDQATFVESLVSSAVNAPTAVDRRIKSCMKLTDSNLTAGDTVEYYFTRQGANGSDTMAAGVIFHEVLFEYLK